MPRIPSVSEVRSVSAAVTRDPGVRATAEDFGLAAARGLANLGVGVGNLGEGIEEYIKERGRSEDPDGETKDKTTAEDGSDTDRGATAPATTRLVSNIGDTMAWDDVAASKHHIAWVREQSRLLIEKQQHRDGPPVEAAGRSQKDLMALQDENLNELPPEQRAKAKEDAKSVVIGHALSAAQRSQNLNVEASMRKMVETLELLKGQAAVDPASAEKFLADGLGLLSQSHEMGALSDAQLGQRSTAFRRDLYSTMLREQKASDVVADLEAGVYDTALDDPELQQLLLIEHRWRMQVEEAQGRANGAAMVSGAAQGDEAQPALSDATRAVLQAGDFADFELEAEKARRVRSGVESLRFAPEDEFEEEIAKLAPAVEGLDQEARLEVQEAVRKGSERLLEERHADPADYAMGLPSVAKAFEAAKADPSLLPSAVSGRLAAQAAMGISPEERRALSKAEEMEILESYRALPAEARGQALKALQQAYGDQCGRVAAELEEAGLPFQVAQALEASGNGARAAQAVDAEQSAASGPQADLITETAEWIIAEGNERSVPPLPGRRPAPAPENSQSFGDDSAVDVKEADQTLFVPEYEAQIEHSSLLEKEYADLIEGLSRSEVASFEEHIRRAVEESGASLQTADLARRLVASNLRSGFPLGDALALAFDRSGLRKVETEESAPDPTTGEAEERVRALLSSMLIRYDQPIHDPERALAMIEMATNARRIMAAEGEKGFEAALAELKTLEQTDDWFLYPKLRNAVLRARSNPVTTPWALTDTELVSLFEATGGSTDMLNDTALLTSFALPLSLAAGLAGRQQSKLRSSYERELKRRGFLKVPER